MPQVPPFLLADNPKHDYYQIYTGLMRYQILTLARSGIEYHWPPSPGLEISVSPLEDTTFQGQQEISPSPFNPPIPHSTYLYHAYPYDTNTIKLPEDECVVACLRVHMGVRCWLTSSGDIYTSGESVIRVDLMFSINIEPTSGVQSESRYGWICESTAALQSG